MVGQTFDEQLHALLEDLLAMGHMVTQSIGRAIQALARWDTDLSQGVIELSQEPLLRSFMDILHMAEESRGMVPSSLEASPGRDQETVHQWHRPTSSSFRSTNRSMAGSWSV